MTVLDDTCDYCATYCDPIGCETATIVGESLWCGWCRAGADARWGRLSVRDLRRAAAEARDEAIWLHDGERRADTRAEKFRLRARRLAALDDHAALMRYAAARENELPPEPNGLRVVS